MVNIGTDVCHMCNNLSEIYYYGSEADWSNITIDMGAMANIELLSATRYYYSETQPMLNGNYWHYGTDGVTPVVWE